jgi:hypothetical protein
MTAPAWAGWLWIHGTWSRVCEGATLASCGKKLAHLARRHRVPDKLSMMTGGGCPTFIPREEVAMKRHVIRLKSGRKTPPIRRPSKQPLPRPAADAPAGTPGAGAAGKQ